MEDLWEKKIKLLTQMPPVYCNIGSPKFAGYFKVELNTWSIDENDYVQVEKDAYFDGKYFYMTDIDGFEYANWISNWCHSSLNVVNTEAAQKIFGRDKWNKDVEKGLRSYGNYEGVEDPIKFRETWG